MSLESTRKDSKINILLDDRNVLQEPFSSSWQRSFPLSTTAWRNQGCIKCNTRMLKLHVQVLLASGPPACGFLNVLSFNTSSRRRNKSSDKLCRRSRGPKGVALLHLLLGSVVK